MWYSKKNWIKNEYDHKGNSFQKWCHFWDSSLNDINLLKTEWNERTMGTDDEKIYGKQQRA